MGQEKVYSVEEVIQIRAKHIEADVAVTWERDFQEFLVAQATKLIDEHRAQVVALLVRMIANEADVAVSWERHVQELLVAQATKLIDEHRAQVVAMLVWNLDKVQRPAFDADFPGLVQKIAAETVYAQIAQMSGDTETDA